MSSTSIARIYALASKLKKQYERFYFFRVFGKYSLFTMIPKATYVANLQLGSLVKDVPGSIVECGVWKGGMIAGLAEVLKGRTCYLYDSFEGLPETKPIDGERARAWQGDTDGPDYFDNCTADESYAYEAMQLSGSTRFYIIKGWFESTIAKNPPEEDIALLRLDGDWYESTMTCLEHLYPRVTKGGLIIIDDYYTWDGCARAVHDYLSKYQYPVRISQEVNAGVCYILKSHE